MTWDNNQFPLADDPKRVGWLISYWRVVPCESGCAGNYRLESRQFDHLVKAATREEALTRFNEYVENRRASGKSPSIKGLTLFLSRVDTIAVISDNTGEIVRDGA